MNGLMAQHWRARYKDLRNNISEPRHLSELALHGDIVLVCSRVTLHVVVLHAWHSIG